MLKYSLRLAGLTLLLGGLYVSTANAGPHFSVQFGIGAPVAPGPYSGYFWQPGYYVWTGYGYQWVPGAWVLPSYGQRGWTQYRWDHGRHDFYRYRGGYQGGWNLNGRNQVRNWNQGRNVNHNRGDHGHGRR